MSDQTVIDELVRDYKWSERTLEVWQRARYECEYCRSNLITDVDDYLYGSHVDHIVPGAGDRAENLALACKACNFIKSDKDFSEFGQSLSRDQLIARATAFIDQRRKINEERLQCVRVLLAALDKSSPNQELRIGGRID